MVEVVACLRSNAINITFAFECGQMAVCVRIVRDERDRRRSQRMLGVKKRQRDVEIVAKILKIVILGLQMRTSLFLTEARALAHAMIAFCGSKPMSESA